MHDSIRALRIGLSVAVVAVMTALVAGGATAATSISPSQPSAQVVVIPGFEAPQYGGFYGIPTFPIGATEVRNYHFAQLSADAITPTALQPYDTVVLYGLRWQTLPATAQAAIDEFAATGKVIIWDSDSTGPQDYSSFVHPFSTAASGETGQENGSVVSFPVGLNPLASPNPSSPLYLDPAQLVADKNLINDMNAMKAGAPEWAPSLIATNRTIPSGGWPLAWGYGATRDHSGMLIYSGIDADAFDGTSTPNYALKELALQLAAPFERIPDSRCAPNCSPPLTSGSKTGSGRTFAQCSLERPAPTSWMRGKISLELRTSIAPAITAKARTLSGKLVGSSTTTKPGRLRLIVNTRLLPSNRASKIVAVVYVKTAQACKVSAKLKVDNVPPHVLVLKTSRDPHGSRLTLRTNETVRVTLVTPLGVRRHLFLSAKKTATILLPDAINTGRLLITGRAGNETTRLLRWH